MAFANVSFRIRNPSVPAPETHNAQASRKIADPLQELSLEIIAPRDE
jgi:hypothetical protein